MPKLARASISALCVALLAALCLVAPAAAQEDAPRLDPNTPAGAEYELPVDRARDEARGGDAQDADAGDGRAPAPLFGEGAEPDAGAVAGASEPSAPAGGSAPSSGGQAPQPAALAHEKLRAQTPQPEGGGALVVVAGGTLGLLLLGGAGGLLWRRGQAPG